MTWENSVQVIIPYYKEFEYFREALASVISQDYPDFSILVIDDGTYDEKVSNLISALDDRRITLIQNTENLGLARNFEFARTSSTADFLVFLGQDDILESNYISTVLPWIASRENLAIAQPNVRVIDADGNFDLPLSDAIKKLLFKIAWVAGKKSSIQGVPGSILVARKAVLFLLLGDFLYFPTLMWKSASMSNFDITKEITLDYRMLIDVLGENQELLLISRKSARYRRHKRSASMNPNNLISRLTEERELHRFFSQHPFVVQSKSLSFVNKIRVTHRLHVVQVVLSALSKRDLKTVRQALRLM
jgi:glycosyltransferase involved in cell wall biosynthesis